MAVSVSLGVSFRVLVNQESLNMAESVGNVTRHRKAPIVVRMDDGTYKLLYVPVVSGMSLAHHYQRHLARAANDMGLNVTRMSLLGYFMKFADDKIIKSYYPEVAGKVSKNKDPCTNEKAIVEACTVADVGGFLYTDGLVKRTSRFSFSYLVPALDAVKTGGVGSTPQLHVRFTPEAKEGQVPFYNDNSSALYTATFLLEVDGIARLDVCQATSKNPGQNPESLGKDEQRKRFQASVKALMAMLGNLAFGAKRTRNLPHWQIQSAVVTGAIGIAPFVPSSGHSKDYIHETLRRATAQKQQGIIKDYTIAVYNNGDIDLANLDLKPHNTLEEAIAAVASWIEKNYFT